MKKGEKLITNPAVVLRCDSLAATLFLILLFLVPAQLLASGFVVYNQDAKADGMATAVTSSIDNPSAVFYNPALLTDQPGFGVSISDTMIMADRSFKDSATGVTTDAKKQTNHVPSLFAKYTRDRWSVGIGIYNPFGLSNDWGNTWVGRYSATYSELKALFVTPTVA